jgi:hypothetical protein
MRTDRPFRQILVLVALLATVPLCCCRVGLAFSMFAGADEDGSTAPAAALVVDSCCAGPVGHGHDDGADPASEPCDEAPGGCVGPCCLKGFTPTPEIELPSADLLAFILPVALVVEEVSACAGDQAPPQIDANPPPEEPAEGSLHSRRCLLLI